METLYNISNFGIAVVRGDANSINTAKKGCFLSSRLLKPYGVQSVEPLFHFFTLTDY